MRLNLKQKILSEITWRYYCNETDTGSAKISDDTLKRAFTATCGKRGTKVDEEAGWKILSSIRDNENLKQLWTKYQKKYDYAGEVVYDDVMASIDELFLVIKE